MHEWHDCVCTLRATSIAGVWSVASGPVNIQHKFKKEDFPLVEKNFLLNSAISGIFFKELNILFEVLGSAAFRRLSRDLRLLWLVKTAQISTPFFLEP